MDEPSEERRRFDWAYVAFLSLLLAGFFILRARRGFEYPTPWADEGSFLWQAINFAEHGTLFAPELNPTRHILWMPPGYMVLTGAVFSVLGFSLSLARLLSGIFVAGAVLAVAYMLRRSPLRFAHALVLTLFLVSPIFQLAANTARMEPLVLLVASVAFAAMSRGAIWVGVSVAALAPLVHPNGLFPAVGSVAFAAALRALEGTWPAVRRRDYAAVAVTLGCWGAYAAYALTHLDPWLVDLTEQLAWKEGESQMMGGLGERIVRPENLLLTLSWGAALGAALWLRRARGSASGPVFAVGLRSLGAVLALSGSFVLQTLATVGWLYDVYAAFAYAVVACAAVELATAFARQRSRAWYAVAATGSVALAIAYAILVPQRPALMRSVTSAVAFPANAPPYVEERDITAVKGALEQLAKWHGPLRIQFLPEADALLFADLRSDHIGFLQQTRYDGVADLYVFHDSVWIPDIVRRLDVIRVAFRQGVPIPVPKWPLIHYRDGTEQWRVYRR